MILRFPDDVQHWCNLIEFTFKTTGKNTKPISWGDARRINNKECDDKLLQGYAPGDDFIKSRPGIYAFIESTFISNPISIYKRVLYIGKAEVLRNRLIYHIRTKPSHIFNKIMDDEKDFEIYVWYMDDFESLEKRLIQILKPKYNTVFNRES